MLRVVVVGSWLCSPPRCDRRRRRRRVLCSPPPVGSVSMLARARGQTKHEGHTGTSDSSILHQNNVNQTSAFGPWLLLLRRGLANLTTSRLRWTAAAVPEPTPQRPGRSRLPVPQPQAFQGSALKAKVL